MIADDGTLRGQGALERAAAGQDDLAQSSGAVSRAIGTAALPLHIDELVDGRYQITGVVGRGGFGAVYSARHLVSRADVAIKVLLAKPQGNRQEAVERFFKEARVLAQLRHPNTVRVYDMGYTQNKDLYFAMELLDGPNLEQVFAEVGRHGRTMTEAQAIDVALPILGALGEAHQLELVHRDLKPANVVLAHIPNESFCVKVLDFGVVRTSDSDLTTRQTALGTPIYMSPEQCESGKIDGRSDLYAVGTLLFEAVCGHTPYPPGNPIDVMFEQMNGKVPNIRDHSRQKLSPGFALAVQKALAKSPEKRFQSATDMRNALEVIRRQSWPDHPITHLDMLLSRGEQRRLSSTFRVVVGKSQDAKAHTEAGVRVGAKSAVNIPDAEADMRDVTVGSAAPVTEDVPALNSSTHDTRIDLDRPATDQTRVSPTARLPAHSEQARPSSPSAKPLWEQATPRAKPFVPDAPQFQTANIYRSAGSDRPMRHKPAFVDESGVAPDPNATGASQAVIRLPSQSEIASAIDRHLRAKAVKNSESATKVEPAEQRTPQMAPPADGDSREVARTRPKSFGKGTLIGTGIPMPSGFRDGDDG